MSSHLRATVIFVLTALCALAVAAQTSTSSISGTVIDATGAIVPGATVTATNEATGITQTQNTTDAGLYAFPALPAGTYTISVEKAGFKTAKLTGNKIEVNTPRTVDVTLSAGDVSEVVTVQAGAEQIHTTNATMGNVVEQKAIEQLPLNGRNPLTLITLEPGVVQRSAGAAGSGVHVNGSRDRAFNVTIDGIEANESSVPNPVSNLYRLNPDNVREYKVTTNNATPEEGRNSGASISVATSSGTNDLHGTGFYFLRNDALNSNDFFSNALGTPKKTVKLNQFGGEVGGPIKRNKTFFFGSYQGNIVKFTQPIDQTFGVPIVYTPQALAGNFRYFRADPSNPLVIDGVTITRNSPLLVNPLTGELRPGVRVCASATDRGCVATYNIPANGPSGTTLNSTVLSLLRSFPAPNSYAFGDGLNTAAFLWNPPTEVRGPNIMARIDHNFSENHALFGRFLFADFNTLKGDPLNGRPQVFPGFPPLGEVFRRTSNLALGLRSVINPRVVNELTVGYARFEFLFTQGEANPAFPNTPPFDFNLISEPYINTPRTYRAVTTPQILDNLSWVKDAHVFKTGFNFRFYRHVDQRGQPGGVNVTPAISFSATIRPPTGFAAASGINSTDNGNLLSTINNLLGTPARISQVFIGNLNDDVFLPFSVGDKVTLFAEQHKLNQFNFYFQDEWKMRPNLTVTYGARWELNPPPTTVGGEVLVASTPIAGTPGPANPQVNQPGAVTFRRADTWFERKNYGAISPSLAFAYTPDFREGALRSFFGENGTSVIRAGYRMAFDTISSFQVTAVAGRVPGLLTTCSSTVGGTTTPGCTPAPNVRIGEGFPTQLTPPSTRPSSFLTPPLQLNSNAPPIAAFHPDLKIPTVHQWNISFQRTLPWGFVGEWAYVGRRGTRLFMAYNLNQINSDPILPSFFIMQNNVSRGCRADGTGCPSGVSGTTPPLLGQLTSGGLTATAAANFLNSTTTANELNLNAAGAFAERIENTTLALRLRPNQQFSTITYIDNSGDSNYHSGQFTLRRRFSHNLGMSLAYTFGKSIDNQSVDPVGAASGGGLSTTNSRTPTDIRNFREERGRSDFDRRHVLNIASVWELPVGRNQRFLGDAPGWVNQILGGWSINGIYTYMSGEPFSVRSGVRTSNAAHESRADVIAPVQARLQEVPGIVGPVVFPNTDAFAIPAPGRNGAGRNIFTAPAYWNLDLGFIKMFRVTERVRLQFRTEMFNALNHTNFDNPRDASVGSPSIRSAVFAQTCCAAVAPPTTQTVIQTGETSRVIQMALKLQF